MRVAVVHGLKRGGAARRLEGTVRGLIESPATTVREFTLGEATAIADERQGVPWTAVGPSRPRVVRPWWRYRDAASVQAAWGEVWTQVNAWGPDVVFMNPCAVPGGAPPRASSSQAPTLYYCDEPRRVDYERDASRASNPATRVPYYPLRRFERRHERAAVHAVDALATNSAYTARQIRSAYGRDAVVITPGIDDVFAAAPPLGGQTPPTHLLSVGSLIPSKGHDLVIRAAQSAGTELPVALVAPRRDEDEERRLHAIAAECGVRLSITCGVSDEELAQMYRSAFATLYLARREPLGLVSLESQACGTPVIVAAEGGLLETVVDGESGFCVERTAQAAGEALRRLAEPEVRDRLASGARRREVPRVVDSTRQVISALEELSNGGAP